MPKGVAVVIINSNFKRTLVGSEYNTRREQCETGARFFQQPALRDVELAQFNAVAHELDPIVAKTRAPCVNRKTPVPSKRRARWQTAICSAWAN